MSLIQTPFSLPDLRRHGANLAVLILPAALWASAIGLLAATVPLHDMVVSSDFRFTYYPAGRDFLDGHDPYLRTLIEGQSGGYGHWLIYPALVVELVAPIAALPYRIAAAVWIVVLVSVLILDTILLAVTIGNRQRLGLASGVIAVSVVGFAPVRWNLGTASLDLLVVFFIVGSLAVLRRRSELRLSARASQIVSGVLLGLATVIKLYPAALIAYYFWKRNYLTALSAVSSFCVAMIGSFAIMGISSFSGYLGAIALATTPAASARPNVLGATGLAHRALTRTGYSEPLLSLPEWAVRALLVAWGLAGVVALGRLIRRRKPAQIGLEGLVVLAATLVIFPLLELNHFVSLMALLPLFWWSVRGWMARSGAPARLWPTMTLLAVGAPLVLGMLPLFAHLKVIAWLTLAVAGGSAAVTAVLMRRWKAELTTKTGLLTMLASYVALASPAFVNMATWWGPYQSRLALLASEGEFYLLLLFVLGSAALYRSIDYGNDTQLADATAPVA